MRFPSLAPHSDGRRLNLQLLHSVFRLTAATVVVLAVELTIQWNDITGVGGVSTAAQLVALLVPAGLLIHVLWIFLVRGQEVEEDGESTTVSVTTERVEVVVD